MIDIFLGATLQDILKVLLSAAGIFLAVISYTRVAGLRSFSKLSGFDFAMTIAVGSIMASVAVIQVTFIEGLVALATLYTLQVGIAYLRRNARVKKLVDNQPVLLMKNGKMLKENMRKSRITRNDILSTLREANVKNIDKVQAVVLETTGDISVIHGEGPLDTEILEGVRNDKP